MIGALLRRVRRPDPALRGGRQVDLKFLPAELARDRQALDRFQRGARAVEVLESEEATCSKRYREWAACGRTVARGVRHPLCAVVSPEFQKIGGSALQGPAQRLESGEPDGPGLAGLVVWIQDLRPVRSQATGPPEPPPFEGARDNHRDGRAATPPPLDARPLGVYLGEPRAGASVPNTRPARIVFVGFDEGRTFGC